MSHIAERVNEISPAPRSPKSRDWLLERLLANPKIEQVGTNSGLDHPILASAGKWGLFLLAKGRTYRLEREHVTGIWLEDDIFYWCLQRNDHLRIASLDKDGVFSLIVNGEVGDIHDVRVFEGQLVAVSTATNEVVSLSPQGEILKRWKFDGAADSWHLNCLDVWNGRLVISAFGDFKWHEGWRSDYANRGIVVDVETKEVLWDKLTKPHTPRSLPDGRLAVCDFQGHNLLVKDKSGVSDLSYEDAMPRGIAYDDRVMYVGLSRDRYKVKEDASEQCALIWMIESSTLKPIRMVPLPAVEIYDLLIV